MCDSVFLNVQLATAPHAGLTVITDYLLYFSSVISTSPVVCVSHPAL